MDKSYMGISFLFSFFFFFFTITLHTVACAATFKDTF